jgi:hypothetical protein
MSAFPVRTLALGAFAAAILIGVSARAETPAYPPYPAVKTLQAVGQWVQAQTDIPLQTVVGIGKDSIFSVEPGRDRSVAPAIRVIIRQEAIDPDFTNRLGGRSAVMTVDLDCAGRRVFQRSLELYAGSNRKGAVQHLGAGTDWRAVPAGSYMDAVLASVCQPGYRALYAQGAAPSTQPAAPRAAVSYAPPAPAAPPYVPARPAGVAVAPLPAPSAPAYAPAPPAARPIPASVAQAAAGARIEIGRYPSANDAIRAADVLAQAYPGTLAGKQRRIEVSTAGGRTEFRSLVEGFDSRAAAESFCRLLQAGGRPCFGAS